MEYLQSHFVWVVIGALAAVGLPWVRGFLSLCGILCAAGILFAATAGGVHLMDISYGFSREEWKQLALISAAVFSLYSVYLLYVRARRKGVETTEDDSIAHLLE